jgi:hypothetical protein
MFSGNGGIFQAKIAVRAASDGQAGCDLDGHPLVGTLGYPEDCPAFLIVILA